MICEWMICESMTCESMNFERMICESMKCEWMNFEWMNFEWMICESMKWEWNEGPPKGRTKMTQTDKLTKKMKHRQAPVASHGGEDRGVRSWLSHLSTWFHSNATLAGGDHQCTLYSPTCRRDTACRGLFQGAVPQKKKIPQSFRTPYAH